MVQTCHRSQPKLCWEHRWIIIFDKENAQRSNFIQSPLSVRYQRNLFNVQAVKSRIDRRDFWPITKGVALEWSRVEATQGR